MEYYVLKVRIMDIDYRKSHATYEKARNYENVVYSDDSYDYIIWKFEKKILDKYLKMLKNEDTNLSCLDFACGTGRIIQYLEEKLGRNDRFIGIDISESMLKIAKSKVSCSDLVRADISRNDIIPNQTFDLITVFRFFLNAQPSLRDNVMSALQAKLRDNNSILIINIHGNKYSYRFITVAIFKVIGKKLQYLSYREVKNFIEKHNLEIIDFYGIGFVPKIMYRLLPNTVLFYIDKYLQSFPYLKYFGYDLVFVCKKNPSKHEY